MTGPLI